MDLVNTKYKQIKISKETDEESNGVVSQSSNKLFEKKFKKLQNENIELNLKLEEYKEKFRSYRINLDLLENKAINFNEEIKDKDSTIKLLERNINYINVKNTKLKEINTNLKEKIFISPDHYKEKSNITEDEQKPNQYQLKEVDIKFNILKNELSSVRLEKDSLLREKMV